MAHIVGVWELGGHLGHLARFAALTARLRAAGHRVSLVLRDLSRVGQFQSLARVPVFQAPLWLPRARHGPSHPRSMVEILWHYGYLSAPGLHSMASAWRALFDVLRPDLVLYDYAPTALLGSQGLNFRRTTIGVGFCMPPTATPLPPFQVVGDARRQRLEAAEERILATVNQALVALGQPALPSMGQLFAADEAFLCTVPEFDPYRRAADVRYWGLVTGSPEDACPVWRHTHQPRVFAYLKPSSRHFDGILDAIAATECQAAVFAPGVSREQVARYRSSGIQLSRVPYDIEQAAGSADVAICHGGHDTTLACLLAGIPAMLVPLQAEQLITARRVEAQGAGILVPADAVDQAPERLSELLHNPRFRQSAQRFAVRHRAARPPGSSDAVVARCEALLAT